MQIEKHLEEWVEAQIVKIGDKKWGSKVSQKLFVDKAFVVKHIRNKHTHLLDAEREQVLPLCCPSPAVDVSCPCQLLMGVASQVLA